MCTNHAHRGVKSYNGIEIGEEGEEETKHKDARKSPNEVTEVKPQALDQSNNNPENDSISYSWTSPCP